MTSSSVRRGVVCRGGGGAGPALELPSALAVPLRFALRSASAASELTLCDDIALWEVRGDAATQLHTAATCVVVVGWWEVCRNKGAKREQQ
jgi:hypothetical protein